jgi:transcriptional regulator with XRE-family HTH domain
MTPVSTVKRLEWTLGDRLRKARQAAGVTPSEMAAYLGVERSMISRYQNDRSTPRVGYLRLWSMRTGVDLDWLRYGDTVPLPHVVAGTNRGPDLHIPDNNGYGDNHSYRELVAA